MSFNLQTLSAVLWIFLNGNSMSGKFWVTHQRFSTGYIKHDITLIFTIYSQEGTAVVHCYYKLLFGLVDQSKWCIKTI